MDSQLIMKFAVQIFDKHGLSSYEPISHVVLAGSGLSVRCSDLTMITNLFMI